MNNNFPNREPVLSYNAELRIVRRLPANAEIKVRAGERIGATHVLAKTDPLASAIRIAVADQLGCAPQEAAKLMMKTQGATIAAGEAIARSRKGLKSVVVASPISGTLMSMDPETGIATIAPSGSGDMRALIPGDIEFVDGKQAVSIRTVGHRVYGVIGIGPSGSGPIRVVAHTPEEALDANRFTPDLAGSIVVGGSWVSAAGIKKLAEIGVAGLITGSFLDREIAASIGLASEDRIAPWRLSPSTESLGGDMRPGFGMVATEGFGSLAMASDLFAFLLEQNGLPAVLLTATRVTGFLSRPALVIPNDAGLDTDASAPVLQLDQQTPVRYTDQGSLGRFGEIAGPTRSSRRSDGSFVDVVDVATSDDQIRSVPTTNLEAMFSRAV